MLPEEPFTGTQVETMVLTGASAALVLASALYVMGPLGLGEAAPGFTEFVVLFMLVVGMVARLKLAFFGTLVLKGLFVVLGLGAFLVQPPALRLGWFPAALELNIALGVAIVYLAARSLRQM